MQCNRHSSNAFGTFRTSAQAGEGPPTIIQARIHGKQRDRRSQSELRTLCASALCTFTGATNR